MHHSRTGCLYILSFEMSLAGADSGPKEESAVLKTDCKRKTRSAPSTERKVIPINPELKNIPYASRDYGRRYEECKPETEVVTWYKQGKVHCSYGATGNIRNNNNAWLKAVMLAYNLHGSLVLSPDDLLLLIELNAKKYICINAEKLRDKFVSHSGKVRLVVTEPVGADETNWDHFFDEMVGLVRTHCKPGVVDALQSNFSTTDQVSSVLSAAVLMDTVQKYFKYGRCIPDCGIRSVHMLGSLVDWERLVTKVQAIGKLDVDGGELQKYTEKVIPILREFVLTYQGKPNVDWWNRIMNLKDGRIGSGSTKYISGWILDLFFGFSSQEDSKTEVDQLVLPKIKVLVTLRNECTGTQKKCSVIGGFSSVLDENQDGVYRPLMGLIVQENEDKTKQMSGGLYSFSDDSDKSDDDGEESDKSSSSSVASPQTKKKKKSKRGGRVLLVKQKKKDKKKK